MKTDAVITGLVDAKVLIDIIREVVGSPQCGCEVGVWAGMTSRELLREFDLLLLLMVDFYQPYEVGGKKALSKFAKKEKGMQELLASAVSETEFAWNRRMLLVASSLQAAGLVRDRLLDFVFIDADHFYESVRSDLISWYPKVRSGGLVCGHDYGGGWDRRGVWGVKRAVDEFAAEHGYKVNVGPRKSFIWWFVKR